MRATLFLWLCCLPALAFAQEVAPAASQPASQPVEAERAELLLDEAPLLRSEPPPEQPNPTPPLQDPTTPVPLERRGAYSFIKVQGNFLMFYLNAGAEANVGYRLRARPEGRWFPGRLGLEASARVGGSGSAGGTFSQFAGGDLSLRYFTPLERSRFGGSARLGLGLESLNLGVSGDVGPRTDEPLIPDDPAFLAMYGVISREYYVILFHHVTFNYGGALVVAHALSQQPRSLSIFPTLNLGLGLVF